ncbi:MAG: zf-HC2 domain-containing protein [Gemmatimonadales bacterium]
MSRHLNRRSCEEAFRRLDDYLDRRLNAAERKQIEDHLRICESCTREFTFEASVLDGVKHKLRHLAAPPDLLSRILAQLSPPGNGGHQAQRAPPGPC